jgi:AbrB family looped-hinge helix DNA binding protein
MRKYVDSSHTKSNLNAELKLNIEVNTPMEATVAERGQITLPKAVRDALGLTKGTTLKVELQGSRIILRKDVSDAISRARGRFKLDSAPTANALEVDLPEAKTP